MRYLALWLALALATPALAKKAPKPPCQGTYEAVASDELPEDAPRIYSLTVDGDNVTLDGCGTTTGSVKRVSRTLTKVRANFATCGSLEDLRLKVNIYKSCATGKGRLRARRGDDFVSARFPVNPADTGPVDAQPETWTWVPVPGSLCANGQPTGFGVNLSTKSNRVILFLNGGGACWDTNSCYEIGTAVNIVNGYTADNFATEAAGFLNLSFFNRNDPANPFKNDSFVYVPYCTGDVHTGDAIRDYGGHRTFHVGKRNVELILPRILATFPNPDRVYMTGSSAGGYGAAFNWPTLKEAYGDVRVDLIDDCGPPLPAPYANPAVTDVWRTAWNLTYPEDCTACADNLDAFIDYWAPKFPNDRAAFLAFTRDPVLRIFYQLDETTMSEATLALADGALSRHETIRYFVKDDASHVMLFTPAGIEQNGVNLLDWLTNMYNDDPGWVSVRP